MTLNAQKCFETLEAKLLNSIPNVRGGSLVRCQTVCSMCIIPKIGAELGLGPAVGTGAASEPSVLISLSWDYLAGQPQWYSPDLTNEQNQLYCFAMWALFGKPSTFQELEFDRFLKLVDAHQYLVHTGVSSFEFCNRIFVSSSVWPLKCWIPI